MPAIPSFPTRLVHSLLRLLILLAFAYVGVVILMALFQRSLIYRPDRDSGENLIRRAAEARLLPWTNAAGLRIGWQRPLPGGAPAGSVLILHGNAGSAVDREYLVEPLQQALPLDVYVLEYPGYGDRPDSPSQSSLLTAAQEAAAGLERRGPLYLVGESLGTGPTAYLAGLGSLRVSGVLFLAPFNRLSETAAAHYPWLPVRWILRDPFPADQWLREFRGPVGVVLAGADRVIPTRLGRALYDGFSGTKRLWEFPGADHDDVVDQPPEWWRAVGDFWGVPSKGRG